MPDTGALAPDYPVTSFAEVCLLLGGASDSFTGDLLRLIAKADPGNRSRIRKGFPRAVAVWEAWQALPAGVAAGVVATLAERSINTGIRAADILTLDSNRPHPAHTEAELDALWQQVQADETLMRYLGDQ